MMRLKYFLCIFFGLIVLFFIIPPQKDKLYPNDFCSFQIVARDGKVLREILSDDYTTSSWVSIEKISPWMIQTTILREDKRFWFHPGVDFLALLRALYENVKHKRIISGGSTITMQVAKITLNFKRRNILTKLVEIMYALKIDLHLSKQEILEVYLNRAPYGNQTYGVEAASRFYYRKSANQLSLGESCVLAVIPKSPTLFDPYIFPERVNREKVNILEDLLKNKFIDSLDFTLALRESTSVVGKDINFEAPHFVDYILRKLQKKKAKNLSKVITSIDIKLQTDLEKLLYTTLESLKKYNVGQGAILVMDTETGEILSMVGSKNYFDAREGQVNGCTALRQPGSSIKPFLYILALTSGIPASYILPDTILEFRLADGTLFAPRNYGGRYHGPTRFREALASSFNVPAVYLVEKLGVQRFHNFLRELHFEGLDRDTKFYGLSLCLGAGEVSLLEMANGYRTIACQGLFEEAMPILKLNDVYGNKINLEKEEAKRVFPREAAYIITDILSDNSSRIKSFGEDNPLNLPFACAAKTGTSKDYRDNWCVGFTRKYVVGVWVGNFDGSPMEGVSGISGAAPLFRDVMIELHRDQYPPVFEEFCSLVHLNICAKSGKVAVSSCPNIIKEIFIPGTEPAESCDIHYSQITRNQTDFGSSASVFSNKPIEIINPSDNDMFKLDPHVSYSSQGIRFKVHAIKEIEEVVFKLDDKILCSRSYPFEYLWKPVPGEHKLEVIVQDGRNKKSDEVFFIVY